MGAKAVGRRRPMGGSGPGRGGARPARPRLGTPDLFGPGRRVTGAQSAPVYCWIQDRQAARSV
ncbi:hypothetical protein GA0115243_1116161 [Streptomyces sp. ScaeMP-e83]|nr:hypothetical protein GA0115243_1116161 [Streptomyces sp. ScaeMP-e83]